MRGSQHDDLLFANCPGVWAWERAIEKQEYRSVPGEYIAEVAINVIGERRWLVTSLTASKTDGTQPSRGYKMQGGGSRAGESVWWKSHFLQDGRTKRY